MVPGVPDLAGALLAGGEGVAALDELDAAGCALVYGRGDEDVDVVRHDCAGMEGELALVLVAEERGDEELGVRGALEVAAALVGEDGEGVGAQLLSDGGHVEESIPQWLKPLKEEVWEGQG